MAKQHEYTFDIKLFAIVRLRAENRSSAEAYLLEAVERAEIDSKNIPKAKVYFVDAAFYADDVSGPYLLEIDGKECDA